MSIIRKGPLPEVARVFTASIFMFAARAAGLQPAGREGVHSEHFDVRGPSSRASARRPAATPHCGVQNQ